MPVPSGEYLVGWVADWFRESGRDTAVIGVSGGRDSAIAAAICVKALGKHNVFGVLLPGVSEDELDDAKRICLTLDICSVELGVGELAQKIADDVLRETERIDEALPRIEPNRTALAKISARVRMTILYAIAQEFDSHGRRSAVVGSANKSKISAGYVTKWGDLACDMNPLMDVWSNDLGPIAEGLGLPPDIVRKAAKTELSSGRKVDYCDVRNALQTAFRMDETLCGTGYFTSSDVVSRYMASRHKRRDVPHPVFSGEFVEKHEAPIASSKSAKQEADRLCWAGILNVSVDDLMPGSRRQLDLEYPYNAFRDIWMKVGAANPGVYVELGYFPPPIEKDARLKRKLEQIIAELGERQQQAFLGRYRDGKTAGVVAEELGVSKSRVRQWTNSAIMYLAMPENYNRIMTTSC